MTNSLEEAVKRHVVAAEEARTHPLKLVYLTRLMKELFDVPVEELAPGIEKELGSRILGVRGKADLIFSDAVLEIKTDLSREIEDAKTQLTKYLQALHELEPSKKHIGIATDAIKFVAFVPAFENGKIVDVHEISSLDVKVRPLLEIIAWFDSFIFSRTEIEPTASDLKIKFGRGSPLHAIWIDTLESMWKRVENDPNVKRARASLSSILLLVCVVWV